MSVSNERAALDHMNAGHRYQGKHNWLSALDEYRKALSSQSKDWGTNYEANVYIAYSLIQLGESEQGIAHCQAAMAIRDRHPLAYAMLGLVMQSQRRWSEAARCFIDATRRNPAMDYSWPHLEHLLTAQPDLVKNDPELGRLVDEIREWREKIFSDNPDSRPKFSDPFFPLMEISQQQ